MGRIVQVSDVHEAVALADRWRDSGEYDWFRGQAKNYPLVPSYARRTEADQREALEKLRRFGSWVQHTGGLAELAAAGADHIIAVAQHYGIPTNFLDFTIDPETAGFFARDSDQLTPGEPSCLVCLNTDDLADFWRHMPPKWPPPEFLRLDIPNLWRLQAQHGVFLFCPYENIENAYGFDRIVFPAGPRADKAMREQMYPARKSQLEILLDQYFMNEMLIQGDRTIATLNPPMKVVRFVPSAKGIDTELAKPGTPRLASWRPKALAAWMATYDERLADVRGSSRADLKIELSAESADIAAQITAQIADVMSRDDAVRSTLVDWKCDLGPDSADRTGELEAALGWLWDGLRALPYSDADIAIGMGNCVGLSVAHDRAALRRPEPGQDYATWQDAANEVLGPAAHVGMDAADGSYSVGYLAEAALLECVRSDIADHLQPGWRDQILGNVVGLMQGIYAPYRLFEFKPLARLFAQQLAPGQVLTRSGRAVFFSPARIIRLGLP